MCSSERYLLEVTFENGKTLGLACPYTRGKQMDDVGMEYGRSEKSFTLCPAWIFRSLLNHPFHESCSSPKHSTLVFVLVLMLVLALEPRLVQSKVDVMLVFSQRNRAVSISVPVHSHLQPRPQPCSGNYINNTVITRIAILPYFCLSLLSHPRLSLSFTRNTTAVIAQISIHRVVPVSGD